MHACIHQPRATLESKKYSIEELAEYPPSAPQPLSVKVSLPAPPLTRWDEYPLRPLTLLLPILKIDLAPSMTLFIPRFILLLRSPSV